LVEAEPIKRLKDWLGVSSKSPQAFIAFIARMLNCALCLGMWVGSIATWDIIYGSVIAVVAELISRKLNTLQQ
jgi:hypothetical protein